MKVIEMDFLFIWKIYLCSRFGFVLCQYSFFFIPLFHCILILYYYGSLIFDFLLVFDYNYKLELVEDFSFLFLLRIRLLLFIYFCVLFTEVVLSLLLLEKETWSPPIDSMVYWKYIWNNHTQLANHKLIIWLLIFSYIYTSYLKKFLFLNINSFTESYFLFRFAFCLAAIDK
jgi:hypothetical protein